MNPPFESAGIGQRYAFSGNFSPWEFNPHPCEISTAPSPGLYRPGMVRTPLPTPAGCLGERARAYCSHPAVHSVDPMIGTGAHSPAADLDDVLRKYLPPTEFRELQELNKRESISVANASRQYPPFSENLSNVQTSTSFFPTVKNLLLTNRVRARETISASVLDKCAWIPSHAAEEFLNALKDKFARSKPQAVCNDRTQNNYFTKARRFIRYIEKLGLPFNEQQASENFDALCNAYNEDCKAVFSKKNLHGHHLGEKFKKFLFEGIIRPEENRTVLLTPSRIKISWADKAIIAHYGEFLRKKEIAPRTGSRYGRLLTYFAKFLKEQEKSSLSAVDKESADRLYKRCWRAAGFANVGESRQVNLPKQPSLKVRWLSLFS